MPFCAASWNNKQNICWWNGQYITAAEGQCHWLKPWLSAKRNSLSILIYSLQDIKEPFFFFILNSLTNASKRITHDNDNRNKNCMHSAVLLQCNSQALLDMCTTEGYIFLSPLLCPECIKWIKALRAAKHIFISSTLRVRAADSRQHIMECHKVPGPSRQIKDGRLKSLG